MIFDTHPYRYVEPIILNSIIGDTEDWTFDSHEAENKKLRIVIWTGNGRWALKVKIDGVKVSPGSDVVLISLAPWRYRLWSRIEKAKAFKTLQKLDAWMDETA